MSVLAATTIGAAAGWICGLVPVWPGARLAAAAGIGSLVGFVGVFVFVLLTMARSGSGGLGAVSLGVSEAVVLGVPVVVLIAVGGYFALRWMGWSPADVARYGPVILGGGAALVTALWLTRGMAISGGS
jgi:hypothetical protein